MTDTPRHRAPATPGGVSPLASDEQGRPARPPRARRRRALRIVLVGLLALTLAAVGAVALYLNAVRSSFDANIQRSDAFLPTASASASATAADGSMNVLVMGTDTRDPSRERGRSDALMLVHVPADRQDLYVVSFPRDMWVSIPGHGKAKINAAYSWGGVPLAVTTMQDLVGVPIDHVVLTDFAGFTDITTALGGVQVDNPVASHYSGCDFAPGRISVEGDCALVYVRERYDLPGGDLDRAERQRGVVAGITDKAISSLSDPARFTDFVATTSQYVTLDSGLTDTELMRTAMSLRGLGADRIHLLQAPVAGFATSPDGQAIDLVDTEALGRLGDALASDTMTDYVVSAPAHS